MHDAGRRYRSISAARAQVHVAADSYWLSVNGTDRRTPDHFIDAYTVYAANMPGFVALVVT